jgi:ribonuclease BN (tRNA processing enzyme)
LAGRPFSGTILLSHLHWDHTQGLPFFLSANQEGARTDVFIPAQGDALAVLARAMSPPHFPIEPSQLRGTWRFMGLEPGEREIEGFSVVALEIPHSAGRTFGYRISDGHATIAYLSDHCPTNLGPGPDGLGEYHPSARRLVEGCDVLLHDAQYTDTELPAKMSWGHAACSYAVGLAESAGAKRLLLFHHDPPRTDDAIDAIVASYGGAAIPVGAAREGMVIDLPGPKA